MYVHAPHNLAGFGAASDDKLHMNKHPERNMRIVDLPGRMPCTYIDVFRVENFDPNLALSSGRNRLIHRSKTLCFSLSALVICCHTVCGWNSVAEVVLSPSLS